MTWIEVADSALKVGLGALISGVTAYLIARNGHARDALMERLRRRLDTVHSTVDEVTEFMKVTLLYWKELANWIDSKSKEASHKLKDSDEAMNTSFHRMTVALNRFYLVGSPECRTALKELAEVCKEFYRNSHFNNPSLTMEAMNEHKKRISAARDHFFEMLEETYFKSNFGRFNKP